MSKHYLPGCKPLNSIKQFERYYISYNPSAADYGSDTTAIVAEIGEISFYVLEGDHREAYHELQGLDSCIDYFIKNIHLMSKFSEIPGGPTFSETMEKIREGKENK